MKTSLVFYNLGKGMTFLEWVHLQRKLSVLHTKNRTY